MIGNVDKNVFIRFAKKFVHCSKINLWNRNNKRFENFKSGQKVWMVLVYSVSATYVDDIEVYIYE